MAECLTDKTIFIGEFHCIYVKSETQKNKVINILNNNEVGFPLPNIYSRSLV